MHLSVTPIGSGRLSARQVAKAVVEYLAGTARLPPPITPPAHLPGSPAPTDLSRATGYYADSVEGPGRWLGHGAAALGLGGEVDHEVFARVLEGRHPVSGERLLRAQGSSDRAHLAVGQPSRSINGTWQYDFADSAKALNLSAQELAALVDEGDGHERSEDTPSAPWLRASTDHNGSRWVSDAELDRFAARSLSVDSAAVLGSGDPTELLSAAQVARLLGVSSRYVRRCCRTWEEHRAEIEATEAAGLSSPRAWLVASRAGDGDSRPYRIARGEVATFVERRHRPVVRVGYDLTLSTEKSVAVLALLGGETRQQQVLAAVDAANDVALRFLEGRAAVGRRLGRSVNTEGLVVASFLHATSRALDPFPHRHNVVANAVIDEHGERRALDGRALYRHAPAAAALATAEMRWRLSSHLGVRWRRSARGVWEVEGVPDATVREFSTRRDEVEAALVELSEALGRSLGPSDTDRVVLATRAAKARTPVEELRADWRRRARETGFDRRALNACFDRSPELVLGSLEDASEQRLRAWLDEASTAESPTFARGEVIEAICRWTTDAGNLVVLKADEVCRLADRFLASERVIELEGRARRGRDSITRRDGVRVDATGGEPTFTTVAHARLEHQVLSLFDRQDAGTTVAISAAAVAAAQGHDELDEEQQRFVHSLCTSGLAVQCGIGRPGSGKTHSLAVAARAWEGAGYRVVGAAVKGEAARLLGDAASVRSETVAWWLTALDAHHGAFDARTVLLVDEATTVGTRDLAHLLDHARKAGAAVRLVGDPAQHGSVAAGGMFAVLCRRRPSEVPVLTGNRRQTSPVDRYVVDAVRAGRVAEALAALRAAGQLTEVREADTLYSAMVTRWFAARRAGEQHPMIDRRNRTRHILNAVAHRLLQAEGEVSSVGLSTADGREFCVGDEVVARRPSRSFHVPGDKRAYVRNGSSGRVTSVSRDAAGASSLEVEFDSLGAIELPGWFVEAHADRRGRVAPGLDYGYALTSYAVQGATLPVSSSALTAGARRRELYVNLTRGRQDNHLFIAAPADSLAGEGHLPRPPEDDVVAEVLRAVGRPDEDLCALEIDPLALAVADARRGHTPSELRALRDQAVATDLEHARVLQRAEAVVVAAAARAAVGEPPGWVSDILPARPSVPWEAARWDAAVGAVAAYRARWEPAAVAGAGVPVLAVLGVPTDGMAADERAIAVSLIGDVWANLATRQLSDYARTTALDPGSRTLLATPPDWLRHHLTELGTAGRLSANGDRRQLAALYIDVARFRAQSPVQLEDSATGFQSLLGPRPAALVASRQWDLLTTRETTVSDRGHRDRLRAK